MIFLKVSTDFTEMSEIPSLSKHVVFISSKNVHLADKGLAPPSGHAKNVSPYYLGNLFF